MLVLSVLAIFAGFPFFQDHFFKLVRPDVALVPHLLHPLLYAMFFGGAGLSALLYFKAQKDPISIPLFANRLYIDNFYNWLVVRGQGGLAVFGSWFDRWIIDGLVVTGSARTVWGAGYLLRLLQLGNLQAYAFFFGAGVLLVLYFLVFR